MTRFLSCPICPTFRWQEDSSIPRERTARCFKCNEELVVVEF